MTFNSNDRNSTIHRPNLQKKRAESKDKGFPWDFAVSILFSIIPFSFPSVIGTFIGTLFYFGIENLIIKISIKVLSFTILLGILGICSYLIGTLISGNSYGKRSLRSFNITILFVVLVALLFHLAMVILYFGFNIKISDFFSIRQLNISEDSIDFLCTVIDEIFFTIPFAYYLMSIFAYNHERKFGCKECNLTNTGKEYKKQTSYEVIRDVHHDNGGIYTDTYKVNNVEVEVQYKTKPESYETYTSIEQGVNIYSCEICNKEICRRKYKEKGYANKLMYHLHNGNKS